MDTLERPLDPATATPDEVVRALFAAFERRDADAVCALCTPDVELHAVTARLTRDGAPYRGHAGMRRYLRDVERVWEELQIEPARIDEHGDRVVMTGRVYAWGEGRVVDQPAGWTFQLRGGRVARAVVHDTARAAAAA